MNELKSELKRRNMTVSGSKPQLVERLKPRLEATVAAGQQMKLLHQQQKQQQQQDQTPTTTTTFVIMTNSKENSPAPGKTIS